MKGFLRFIACVIVIACIVFIALYLTDSKGLLNKIRPALDNNNQDEIVIDPGNKEELETSGEEKIEDEIIPSGESGEENIDKPSGEAQLDVSGEKARIDLAAKELDAKPNIKTLNVGIKSEVGGKSVSALLDAFEDNSDVVLATVYVKKGKTEISYITDFVDNQVFYFDEENNLMLYKTISNTVGGEVRYYFKDGQNILTELNYDEEVANQSAITEDASDILRRADLVLKSF